MKKKKIFNRLCKQSCACSETHGNFHVRDIGKFEAIKGENLKTSSKKKGESLKIERFGHF